MPHILQRQADGDFLLKANTWTTREVGDDTTNPLPTFADGSSKINQVLFFRNRLAVLSGENVILSRPGELAVPSFFAKTALAVSAIDPIDISSSSTYPSDLFDGIEIPAGLVVFSTNQQFLLSADAEVLNPDTAKFRSISHYSYDKNISPISLGTTIGYVDNTGGSCRFMEMQQVQREQEPVVSETSKVVQAMMPNTINHVINSPENGIVLLTSINSGDSYPGNNFYGFKYQDFGERKQAAWFQWHFEGGATSANNSGMQYSFIIDDALYLLNSDDFLMKHNLIISTRDDYPDDVNNPTGLAWNSRDIYLHNNMHVYLDNWVPMVGGVYNSVTQDTTFTHGQNGCDFAWSNSYSNTLDSIGLFAVGLKYDISLDDANQKSYALAQQVESLNKGTSFVVSGDWSNTTIYLGWTYGMSLEFPQFYYTQQQGEQIKVDRDDYLTIHRIKIFTDFYSYYEATAYNRNWAGNKSITKGSPATASTVVIGNNPVAESGMSVLPVYDKNTNTYMQIIQSQYSETEACGPFNLQSLTWEGDYSPKNYRRL